MRGADDEGDAVSDKDPYGDTPPSSGGQPPSYGEQPSYGDQPTASGDQPSAGGGQPPQYGGPPPQGGGHSPWPGGQADASSEAKGFFGALFDFSFTHFVTPKIVKVVYILATVALVLFYLILMLSGLFSDEPLVGVLVLLLGWIPLLVYLALVRMTLEFYFALVRMSEDIHQRLPR
ncbi:MAG: DUF4282 domain-containing protein [Actinomycetota bacterium]|nr:DUF4282 domain-containing protein [Actinomycetota bacterium]